MLIERLIVGFLDTNCYIVASEKDSDALIIDPGFREKEFERIIERINVLNLNLTYIINTHGHVDHISGNDFLRNATGAKLLIHNDDSEMLRYSAKNLSQMLGISFTSNAADYLLVDHETVKIGNIEFEIIHTPGHSKGSVSIYSKNEKYVFTGDTLFAGSIGRTDFYGSSFKDIIYSIKEKLMKLPDETLVFPGHGPETSIGNERRNNPFI